MHTAETADHNSAAEDRTALPLRDDTFLGVCEAIGQDFGFNPNWLRIALAAGLLWNAEAIVGIYFGLGILVAISRLVFPRPRPASAPQPAEFEAGNEIEPRRLAA